MKTFYALLLFAIVVLACDGERAEVESLPFRGSERGEITPAREIVDGRWIVTGNSERRGDCEPSRSGVQFVRRDLLSDGVGDAAAEGHEVFKLLEGEGLVAVA